MENNEQPICGTGEMTNMKEKAKGDVQMDVVKQILSTPQEEQAYNCRHHFEWDNRFPACKLKVKANSGTMPYCTCINGKKECQDFGYGN